MSVGGSHCLQEERDSSSHSIIILTDHTGAYLDALRSPIRFTAQGTATYRLRRPMEDHGRRRYSRICVVIAKPGINREPVPCPIPRRTDDRHHLCPVCFSDAATEESPGSTRRNKPQMTPQQHAAYEMMMRQSPDPAVERQMLPYFPLPSAAKHDDEISVGPPVRRTGGCIPGEPRRRGSMLPMFVDEAPTY